MSIQLGKVLDTVGTLVGQFGQHGENLMAAVEQALNTRAWDSGHVTGSRLKEILDEYKRESIRAMDGQLQSVRQDIQRAIWTNRQRDDDDEHVEHQEVRVSRGCGGPKVKLTYSYDGRFYSVPQGYEFPKVNLKDGLRIWLKEQTISTDGMDRIKPLRKISLSMLPKRLAQQVRVNFLPIFKFLEPVLLNLPKEDGDITEEIIQKAYDDCISFLKGRVSYLFQNGRTNPTQYSLGTWSNKTSFSAIAKAGTEQDKAAMSEANRRNHQRQPKTTETELSTHAKYPKRQGKNRRQAGQVETAGPSFATAFAHVGELTEAMEQRLEEIRVETEAMEQETRREEEARQIREEGWASRPIPAIRNYGDVSAFDRQQIGQTINEIYPASNENSNPVRDPVRGVGRCCIPGCAFPSMQLLHRCTRCKRFIHMPCAEPFNNLAEDERYCNDCVLPMNA